MRKVFLEELPRKEGIGSNNGAKTIDWNNCIGLGIKFVYDNIDGVFEVTKYDGSNQRLYFIYNSEEISMLTSNLIKCKIGKVIGLFKKGFYVKAGDKIYSDNRDMSILNVSYLNSTNKYCKYHCNKCGYEDWMLEDSVRKGNNCRCCTNQIAVLGINTIWDTDRWMCGSGVSEEDAKRYTKSSGQKTEVTCPDCGRKRNIKISDIYRRRSISCTCGDSFSYISKYVVSLLNQINTEFNTEVKYEWNKYINPLTNNESQAYIDFVIYYNNREIPLEADGGFHRKDNNMSGQTKEMSEYIDRQRDENCLKYLGEETIRISDEGDVKENVLNSKLNELFDLTNINWLKCEEFALSNLVREVCEYWRNKEEWETTANLSLYFGINQHTIIDYLKRGSKLEWCDYNTKEEMRKTGFSNGAKNGKIMSKKVLVFKDSKFVKEYESISDLERNSLLDFNTKLYSNGISAVARGIKNNYKGFEFKFACKE